MQKYRVVVCENCGCEYNPVGRKLCPGTGCGQATPEDPAIMEARLAKAEAALAKKEARAAKKKPKLVPLSGAAKKSARKDEA